MTTYSPLTLAQHRLVLDNLGLVCKIAWRATRGMASRIQRPSWRLIEQFYGELEDAGIIGLCIAASKYDPSQGAMFSTYAFLCIKGGVSQAERQAAIYQGAGSSRQKRRCIPFSDLEKSLEGQDREHNPFDVWDHRDQESDPGDVHPGLLALLALAIDDERDLLVVKERVFADRTLQAIADDAGISKERVRQIYERALRNAKNNRPFMTALIRQMKRHRDELTARDFWGLNIASCVA